jgi:dihydrodipicolinate synthase/N-acetylneuraminate lyase
MIHPHGIIPALITPFDRFGEKINDSALRNLIRNTIGAGVHGLFAVGSRGELWALTLEEKKPVWEIVVDEVDGIIPVHAGIEAITTRGTKSLTKLGEVENIVGIRDSNSDLQLSMNYIRSASDDFAVVMARGSLISSGLMVRAKGTIAATGNVGPELAVRNYEGFRAGVLETAKEAQEALFPLHMAYTWGTFPVVIKEALSLMGLDRGPARGPAGPMFGEQRKKLERLLKSMGRIG